MEKNDQMEVEIPKKFSFSPEQTLRNTQCSICSCQGLRLIRKCHLSNDNLSNVFRMSNVEYQIYRVFRRTSVVEA